MQLVNKFTSATKPRLLCEQDTLNLEYLRFEVRGIPMRFINSGRDKACLHKKASTSIYISALATVDFIVVKKMASSKEGGVTKVLLRQVETNEECSGELDVNPDTVVDGGGQVAFG